MKVCFCAYFGLFLLFMIFVFWQYSGYLLIHNLLASLILATPPFLVLWAISYIAFGSGNPFFVFKYKPHKKPENSSKNEEIIDTEVVS